MKPEHYIQYITCNEKNDEAIIIKTNETYTFEESLYKKYLRIRRIWK
jgi:hypothetical protein